MSFIKIFLPAILLFSTQLSIANYAIQTFPGHLQISVDPRAILQQKLKPIDLLFVVDDSGSMDVHQDQLRKLINSFAGKLIGLDIKAGVITTTTNTSVPIKWHLSNQKNWAQDLEKSLLVGVSGSGIETPFKSIIENLDKEFNGNNIRKEADLVIILVTDAEDQSQVTSEELSYYLIKYKSDIKSIALHGLIVPDVTVGCQMDDPQVHPIKIQKAISIMNGIQGVLCGENNIRQGLDLIAKDIQRRAHTYGIITNLEIPLPNLPLLSSVQVQYGSDYLVGGDLQQGWFYDNKKNLILIGSDFDFYKQSAGTLLTVRYKPKDWQ